MTELTKSWVEHWAALYREGMGDEEPRLLGVVGPAGRARGYFTLDELVDIGRWKANRTTGRIRANSEADVEEVTRLAISSSENMRHRILCVLSGVGVPMASAVLTIWNSDLYTVYDVRASESLKHLRIEPPTPGYASYRRHCLELADRLDVQLRDLDRALWKWSQNDMPERA